MADDLTLSSGYDDEPSQEPSSGGDDAPTFAPGHDQPEEQPAPDSKENRIITPEEIRSQQEAVNNAYKGIIEQQRSRATEESAYRKELEGLKAQSERDSPKEPPPMALPAPPNQEQKNNIATLATNILKIGAIAGLAYGFTRRSPHRAAMFKLGLGSALSAYYDGKIQDRNQTLAAWEKNRQFIADQNRQQHQQYMDTVNNNKLSFQQKMDVLRMQGELWNNGRMQDAAVRSSVVDMQKTLNDEIKMERDFETQIRRDRKEWYKHMGLDKAAGQEYRDWVMRKGGPDVATLGDDADAWHKVESRFPRYQMLDEKFHEEQRRQVETARLKSEAELRGRYEEKKREENIDKGYPEGGLKNNPLGLNLGQ